MIRQADRTDYSTLIRIWESSVRATHLFLNEEEINYYKEQIMNSYFDLVNLYCLVTDGVIRGFIGWAGNKIEMLFIDPSAFSKGYGSELLRKAITEGGCRLVDVNEENPKAVAFYKRSGFVVSCRSEKDADGRDHPILHLRLPEDHS